MTARAVHTVATLPSRLPLKHWLTLSVLVLLVHLGLLESVPISLGPPGPAASLPMSFATRSLIPPPEPAPPPPSAVVKRPPKAAPQAVSPPLPPATAAPQTSDTEPEAAPPEPAPGRTELPQDTKPELAVPPELAASAPEPISASDALAASAPAQAPTAMPLHFSAESLSPSTRLIYVLKTNKFPFPVHGELLWLNQGNAYSARLFYGLFGLTREQTSRGLITPTGLEPERFSDKYRSELAAHFNYGEHKISFSANTPDVTLLPGAQDRLSVLLQLGALLASEPEQYPPGRIVSIQTVGPRDADTWLFTVVSIEPLDLTRGTTQAIKLERNPRRPYDQKVEVWLAPDLGYLPARIRITEANGDNVDQVWVATEPASPPP